MPLLTTYMYQTACYYPMSFVVHRSSLISLRALTGRKTPSLNAARLYNPKSSKMATAWKIHIDPENTGLCKVKQTDEAAKKATELLQKDLEASDPSS